MIEPGILRLTPTQFFCPYCEKWIEWDKHDLVRCTGSNSFKHSCVGCVTEISVDFQNNRFLHNFYVDSLKVYTEFISFKSEWTYFDEANHALLLFVGDYKKRFIFGFPNNNHEPSIFHNISKESKSTDDSITTTEINNQEHVRPRRFKRVNPWEL